MISDTISHAAVCGRLRVDARQGYVSVYCVRGGIGAHEAHYIRLCLYIRHLRKNITLLTLTYQDNKRKKFDRSQLSVRIDSYIIKYLDFHQYI